jgi:hypothetical protein
LVADCYSILARRRHRFSRLFNAHGVSDGRKTEICTAEPLLPDLSTFAVGLALGKLKRHKSPGVDQIPAELIKAGGRKIHSDILKLINSIWNKEELPEQWNESVVVRIYRKGDKQTVTAIQVFHFCQLRTKFIQHPAIKVNSICRGNYWGSSVWI